MLFSNRKKYFRCNFGIFATQPCNLFSSYSATIVAAPYLALLHVIYKKNILIRNTVNTVNIVKSPSLRS